MRSLSISLIFIGASLISTSQEMNHLIFDEGSQQEILYGRCTPKAFLNPLFEPWYTYEFNSYTPQKEILRELEPFLKGVTIQVVMATWCGDSQREVPHFLKIVSELNLKKKFKVELICVNRAKVAPEIGIYAGYVQFVPTFIVSRKGQEIDRIVEAPSVSLEADLLAMFNKFPAHKQQSGLLHRLFNRKK